METNLSTEEKNEPATGVLAYNILKKYGLEENIEDSWKKIEKGELTNKAIINRISKDFANNLVSEKNAVTSLQKYFNIPSEKSVQIFNDIKTTILPILKKIKPSKNQTTNNLTKEKLSRQKISKLESEEETIKIPKKISIKTSKTSSSDTYREPIE